MGWRRLKKITRLWLRNITFNFVGFTIEVLVSKFYYNEIIFLDFRHMWFIFSGLVTGEPTVIPIFCQCFKSQQGSIIMNISEC